MATDNIGATAGSGTQLRSFADGDGNEWVGNIIGYVTGGSADNWTIQYVNAANPFPVTISGVATAANQATEIASLSSIDGKLPALGQALAAASVPVVLTAAQLTTLTPPAAITGFALESGGNLAAAATDLAAIEVLLTTIEGNQLADGHNVTVDNASIAVTGTFWQATQPVSNAGTFAVQVSSAIPAGTNNIGDVDVLSVVPGTSATSLGKAEDAVHSSGDTGVMMLAVRQDSQAGLAADGDYLPPTIDAAGGLRVSIVAGAGSGGTASADDDDFTAGTTSGTPAMGVYESTPTSVTDGDLGTVGITATRAMRVSVDSTVTVGSHDVTNAGTFATQSAQSGTWTVDLGATDNAVLDAIAASVAGTLTVGSHDVTNAGTFQVQAAQSGTWNITDISGTVSLPTGASTLAEQQSQTTHLSTIAGDTTAIETAVQLIDDTVATLGTTTYTEAATKGLIVGAIRRDADTTLVDTTNEVGPLQMNAAGQLKVEVFSGETLPVSLTSTTVTGTVAVTQSGTWDEVGINDSGNSITVDAPVGTPVFVRLSDGSSAIATLPVSLASVPSHAVTNAGTFVVQVDGTALTRLTDIETNTDSLAVVGNGAAATALRVTLANDSTGIVALTTSTASIGKLAANSGVDIGDVDVTSLPAITIAGAQTLDTVTTLGTLTGGGVAHDSADSGNPVKTGARAAATLSDDTMVANGDRTDAVSDLDGALLVRPNRPLGDLISERVTNTDGSSTAFTNFGATASTRNVITGYSVYNSSATDGYIDFRDGTAGAVLWTVPIPTLGGANFAIPDGIFRTSANTALAYDVSGALSTVYISITGFKSKV